ncbi:dehydrogenase, partial [Campylobacter jejuni subsp. jejuni]
MEKWGRRGWPGARGVGEAWVGGLAGGAPTGGAGGGAGGGGSSRG